MAGFPLSIPKKGVSIASIIGVVAMISYLLQMSAMNATDWRKSVFKSGQYSVTFDVGLVYGSVAMKKQGETDDKANHFTTEWKMLDNGKDLQDLRAVEVTVYTLLTLSCLSSALATLFIVWASKPWLNVLMSLLLLMLSVLLCTGSYVLANMSLLPTWQRGMCPKMFNMFQTIYERSKHSKDFEATAAILKGVSQPACSFGAPATFPPELRVLVAALLSMLATLIAAGRIWYFRLPFFTRVLAEMAELKQRVQQSAEDMDDASTDSPLSAGTARRRKPLI